MTERCPRQFRIRSVLKATEWLLGLEGITGTSFPPSDVTSSGILSNRTLLSE